MFFANKGIGRGISVLELVTAFEAATGTKVPLVRGQRRFGDVGTLICDSSRALAELDWAPKYDLRTMCKERLTNHTHLLSLSHFCPVNWSPNIIVLVWLLLLVDVMIVVINRNT